MGNDMRRNLFGDVIKVDDNAGFADFIKDIKDHRLDRKKLYSVVELIFLAFCGFLSNCDSWEDIELFGNHNIEFLRRFYPYTNGIPSDDTLRRFFRILDPIIFEAKFEAWVKYILKVDIVGKVIAIDGKTSRGSHDGDVKAMHVVSAFVGEDRVTLASSVVDCKSNEIKAIPKLLDVLDIKGAIITIDAMGTQHKIANKIIDNGGNYILALKGNQKTLETDVKEIFDNISQIKKSYISVYESNEKSHGRIETRGCTVITDDKWLQWLKDGRKDWDSINSVIKITSTRSINGIDSVEDRFYISGLINPTAEQSLAYIRSHWAIENNLHWTLDMSFGDDKSRVRKGNAPQNILVLKKASLTLLEKIKARYPRINGARASIARLRKLNGWVNEWLLKTLCAEHEAETV
jgi:predicted transposase YbfD/YdcC